MRALLYAPGGGHTGIGHTMRSLGLAEEALGRGWQVGIAGYLDGAALEQAKLIDGLTVIGGDRNAFIEHASGVDVVHLDSYDMELPNLRATGCLVSSMADGDFGLRVADLTVDISATAPGRVEFIRERSGGEALVGPDFSALRARVRRFAGGWAGSGAARPQVLVVMGGTDPVGLTVPVVRALSAVPGIEVTVVASADIHPVLQQNWDGPQEALRCVTFLEDLPAATMRHDLVVSASGTSVWEFAAVGVPMALVCAVENQVENYRSFVSRHAAIGLTSSPGTVDDVAATVSAAVHSPQTLQRLSQSTQGLVDGRGAGRVIRAWESLLRCPPSRPSTGLTTIRPAHEADSETLRAWRNDETSRHFSRQPDPIDRSTHERWFESVLARHDRHLLVAEVDGLAVGTVRWDQEAPTPWEARWEVSITLAPEQRGRGLALPMLMSAEEWLAESCSGPQRLLASVHAANQPSARLFARAGYLPDLDADAAGFERLSRSIVGVRG